jgi:oxygen-independent coproporphyrinogen-3 oxidase
MAALADLVRLFFGQAERIGDSSLTAPSDLNLFLTSAVDPPISAGKARLVSRSGRSDQEVRVTSRLEGKQADMVSERIPLHLLRRVLKRQLYLLLSRATGLDFPWGSLTGVRPTQIALEVINQSGEDQAAAILSDYWRLSGSKAALAVKTALAEDATLRQLEEDDVMLYVGLPFCPGRCLYCSFITQDAGRQEGSLVHYVDAVIREAGGIFTGRFPGKIRAVYYGGGTPTSLPPALFRRYLEEVLALAPLKQGAELTMEAGRPDTLDREKLEIIRDCGFQRLCINPQTMHDETLRRIGRHHTTDQTVASFRLARSLGFTDINMDLIAGLPGESTSDLLDSVKRVLELNPEHITLHTLAVKKGSYLDRLFDDHGALLPDPVLIEAVGEAHRLLGQAGFRPYYLYKQKNCRSGLENTGFTRLAGSLYNVAMMSDQVPVVGLGSGSTSKVILERTARRLHNPKDLRLYIERVDRQVAAKRSLFLSES